MTHSKRRFFSGASLEQALMLAARYHRLDPDDVDYRVVEKRHGFVRIRRSIVIEVDPARPRREARSERQVAARPTRRAVDTGTETGIETVPETVQPAPRPSDLYPPATGALGLAAERALLLLFELAGLELDYAVRQGEERFEIELWGADSERAVRDRGEPLLAIQHLVPRLIRGLVGESMPCRVDCADFHRRREERLKSLARITADEVSRRHRPRRLDPMAPDERRIVHLALADDPAVITESQGEGYFKRVTVKPRRDR